MSVPPLQPPPDPARYRTDEDFRRALYHWCYDVYRFVNETGILDHGALAGLADDDHAQYLKEKASGGAAAEVPAHTHADAANAGQVAHTDLTSIGTNTHAQIDTHVASTANPHTVTLAQVGGEAAGTTATHAALTATHGVAGAIVGTTDDQTITTKNITLKGATDQLGTAAVLNAAAATAATLADNSTGTPAASVEDGTAAYSQAVTNNNIASLAAQVNALIADNAAIRTQLNSLLGELRMTNGCGVLSD